MPNKRWAGLGLPLSKKRESEKTETKLRASSETIFKLTKKQISNGLQISFVLISEHSHSDQI
jgi:hypothetical protein